MLSSLSNPALATLLPRAPLLPPWLPLPESSHLEMTTPQTPCYQPSALVHTLLVRPLMPPWPPQPVGLSHSTPRMWSQSHSSQPCPWATSVLARTAPLPSMTWAWARDPLAPSRGRNPTSLETTSAIFAERAMLAHPHSRPTCVPIVEKNPTAVMSVQRLSPKPPTWLPTCVHTVGRSPSAAQSAKSDSLKVRQWLPIWGHTQASVPTGVTIVASASPIRPPSRNTSVSTVEKSLTAARSAT